VQPWCTLNPTIHISSSIAVSTVLPLPARCQCSEAGAAIASPVCLKQSSDSGIKFSQLAGIQCVCSVYFRQALGIAVAVFHCGWAAASDTLANILCVLHHR
jgi:hypothetical protein